MISILATSSTSQRMWHLDWIPRENWDARRITSICSFSGDLDTISFRLWAWSYQVIRPKHKNLMKTFMVYVLINCNIFRITFVPPFIQAHLLLLNKSELYCRRYPQCSQEVTFSVWHFFIYWWEMSKIGLWLFIYVVKKHFKVYFSNVFYLHYSGWSDLYKVFWRCSAKKVNIKM